ncbi:uncharacterized protein A1O5_06418 [Cladophialophora psammophila CBS 110553]|uniref:Zn(2)-C6 fungal-type domain-containing protein n=1 Tax=Cladophialophora psammophila CBS 110553 TaxID=1182543 RepID=W9WZ89_9EURO|nr:uncharacterized protein A1O5_06418 [Cladophialophora psammophila CBS 110553]EXJ70350.1 hypothetical protein A1O5_06418 [Cladophialophora psammophila CBS 110553]
MGHQRSACDRCRSQKLRCPRSDKSKGDPCARCLGVGVQCVTSSARPLGRPRTTGVAERRTRSIKTGNTAPETLSVGLTSPRPPSTTVGVQPCSNLWTSASLDPFSDYLPDPSIVTGSYFENPVPSLTFQTNVECAFDLQLPPHDDLFDIRLPTELSQRPQNSFSQPAFAESHSQGPSLEPSKPADTLTALSRLNEDIVRQHSQLNSYLWGPVNGAQHCLDKFHKVEGNPMAELLQSTSQFVAILENLERLSLPPNKTVDRSLPHLPPASDSDFYTSISEQRETMSPVHGSSTDVKPLSMPVALMLLSSYLLLVELYDALFIRVRDALSKLADVYAFFHELPEFRVAGLPSMKVHLYAKIILQIIEHHFDRLGRLLGLPKEFDLSEQTTHCKGLLGTTDLSQLLQVTMTQMSGSPRTSGSLTLKSFRSNLKGIQAMLPG